MGPRGLFVLLLLGVGRAALGVEGQVVPYVETPDPVVDAMLSLAQVRPTDVVYDLGCGDGRLVLAAVAAGRATRGVGIEIDPDIAERARVRVAQAGLGERVTILTQDIFSTPLHQADVVLMYLLFTVNLRLRPQLVAQLRPGARVVSHRFSMGDAWPADRSHTLSVERDHRVYQWVVPASVGGDWRLRCGEQALSVRLEQVFQQVRASPPLAGWGVVEPRLAGERLEFMLVGPGVRERCAGEVKGDVLYATCATRRCSGERAAADVAGDWTWREGVGPAQEQVRLSVVGVGGAWSARLDGVAVPDFYLWGASVYLSVGDSERDRPSRTYSGTVSGARLAGVTCAAGACAGWEADRAR